MKTISKFSQILDSVFTYAHRGVSHTELKKITALPGCDITRLCKAGLKNNLIKLVDKRYYPGDFFEENIRKAI